MIAGMPFIAKGEKDGNGWNDVNNKNISLEEGVGMQMEEGNSAFGEYLKVGFLLLVVVITVSLILIALI